MANSVDPDQTAPIGAVCSGSKLFASILNSSVMLDNYLQQTTSADDIFRCIYFLALYGLTSAYNEMVYMTTVTSDPRVNIMDPGQTTAWSRSIVFAI